MTDAAAKAPSLRASMSPAGLKRTSVAKPPYVVWAPFENDTVLLLGDAEGVASNTAVNVAAWLVKAVFCHPLVGVAVTQLEVEALTVTATSSLAVSAPSFAVRRRT